MAEPQYTIANNPANQFFVTYGRTLAGWAQIEYMLSRWFFRLTKIDHNLADSLFYSGRSFQTRRDLFKVAIAHDKNLDPELRALLRLILKRCNQYSSARNEISHGMVVYDSGEERMFLAQGDSLGIPHHRRGIPEIDKAGDYFHTLANLMLDAFEPAKREESRKRLSELPTEALPPIQEPQNHAKP